VDLEQIFSFFEVFFSDTAVVTFSLLIIAIFANIVIRLPERRVMRPIAALDKIADMAGASIESNQSLHVSIGSATIGDSTTMLAMLGSEFIYFASREVAIGDAPPLFTMSEGAALPIAADTLRRAFQHENRRNALTLLNVIGKTPISTRWYPAGKRSLAFTSALMAIQSEDKVSGNILMGRYGIELALILEAAYRNKRPAIAGSDDLDGMAVAYAMADEALIGEEILTVSAYPADDIRTQKRNFSIDLMRGLIVVAIIAFALYNFFAGG